MALNSSGPISLAGTTAGQSIQIELGGTGTTAISLNNTNVRTLAGVTTPNSQIAMPTNFWGKSNRAVIGYTFSADTSNASLNVSSIAGYVAGKSDITVTVNAGIYLYSTTTSSAGLTLSGGTTGDTITLVNNGYIMGCGGAGAGYDTVGPVSAGNGGTALSLSFNTTINNTNGSAYIGGGGGGGGNGTTSSGGGNLNSGSGGGGAGGGAGGNYLPSTGGTGGSIGSSGGNGTATSTVACGGGGGRIFPGTGGAGISLSTTTSRLSAGGNGGGAGGGGGIVVNKSSGASGTGGSSNSGGGSGSVSSGTNIGAGGGGGGWGAIGGVAYPTTIAPGTGGNAVSLNGNSVTWVSGDTSRVYGAIS